MSAIVSTLAQRVRIFLAEPLNRTAVSLMLATVTTAALGVVFWAVATRLFPTAEVGRDGALITAMMAIAVTFDLSTNNFVLRFFPQLRVHLARRVCQAYLIGAGAAFVGAALFVALASLASDQFAFFRDDRAAMFGFPLAVVLWSLFVLQGSVLTAFERAPWLPATNGAFAAIKVAAVAVLALASLEFGIFVGWVAPLLVVIPVVNWLIFTRVVPAAAMRQAEAPGILASIGRRRLFSFVGQDIVSTAATEVATSALPLIVLATAGPIEGAYFVVPFALIEAFDMLFFAVAVSVVTEGARDHSRIPAMMRLAWRRLLTFTLPSALLLAALAPLLMLLNGGEYVEHAATPLRLLAVASIFRAVVILYSATLRLQSRGSSLAAVQIISTLLILGGVVALTPEHGAEGAALGWLLGLMVTAIAVLIPLLRFVRRPVIDGTRGPIDLVAEYEEISKRGVG